MVPQNTVRTRENGKPMVLILDSNSETRCAHAKMVNPWCLYLMVTQNSLRTRENGKPRVLILDGNSKPVAHARKKKFASVKETKFDL